MLNYSFRIPPKINMLWKKKIRNINDSHFSYMNGIDELTFRMEIIQVAI